MTTAVATGLHLVPYARGVYAPDVLYGLWRAMHEERALDAVFHDGQPHDLAYLLNHFHQPSTALLLVVTPSGEIVGACWFDEVTVGFRAFSSIFMRRRYWGKPTEAMARQAVAYGFEQLALQSMWAATPVRMARRLAERLGYQLIATLPDLLGPQEQPRSVWMLRLTKESWHG